MGASGFYLLRLRLILCGGLQHGPQRSTAARVRTPSLQVQGQGGLLLVRSAAAAAAAGQGAPTQPQGPGQALGSSLQPSCQTGPVPVPRAAVPVSSGAAETSVQVCRRTGQSMVFFSSLVPNKLVALMWSCGVSKTQKVVPSFILGSVQNLKNLEHRH